MERQKTDQQKVRKKTKKEDTINPDMQPNMYSQSYGKNCLMIRNISGALIQRDQQSSGKRSMFRCSLNLISSFTY